MINFFIPESNNTFNTGLGYFFTAVAILFLIKPKWNNALKVVSFLTVGLLIFFSLLIWGKDVHLSKSFFCGLGHLLCGLILFLSHRKKLVFIATT
jgi:hypothetical protein